MDDEGPSACNCRPYGSHVGCTEDSRRPGTDDALRVCEPIIPAGGAPPVAWGAGGRVEWWAGKGTNIGGEIEGVFVPAYTVQRGCCGGSSGQTWAGALFSFNGMRYLARSTNGPKWEPFITGGAGVIVADGFWSSDLGVPAVVKFGGGVDRWSTPHRGVRFEILDQLAPTGSIGFRFGLIFR